jgi:Rrf2 family protein
MRLSRASRYALNALAYIAQQKLPGPVSTKDIAATTGIPSVFLLKALKPCVARRLLASITGPHGGYRLAKEAEAITLLDIIEAVDGPMVATGENESRAAPTWPVDQQLNRLLSEATNQVRLVFSSLNLAQLAAQSVSRAKKK